MTRTVGRDFFNVARRRTRRGIINASSGGQSAAVSGGEPESSILRDGYRCSSTENRFGNNNDNGRISSIRFQRRTTSTETGSNARVKNKRDGIYGKAKKPSMSLALRSPRTLNTSNKAGVVSGPLLWIT